MLPYSLFAFYISRIRKKRRPYLPVGWLLGRCVTIGGHFWKGAVSLKIFVPGRICLFGEHSDWAGGYRRINADIESGFALIAGTNQGIYAEVEPHPSALVLTSTTPDGTTHGPYEVPMEPKALLAEARRGGFWSYIAGVAYQVLTHYHVRGLVINNYQTDMPVKKGLSSSAAICVLTARAFNRVYDLKMTVRGEMEMAYQGEIVMRVW
jgi:galactokinase